MTGSSNFAYNKRVDFSVLYGAGFTIMNYAVEDLWRALGYRLNHGERRNIKIVIGGKTYDAILWNQDFDKENYRNHADVVQVRYPKQSEIAKALRM